MEGELLSLLRLTGVPVSSQIATNADRKRRMHKTVIETCAADQTKFVVTLEGGMYGMSAAKTRRRDQEHILIYSGGRISEIFGEGANVQIQVNPNWPRI